MKNINKILLIMAVVLTLVACGGDIEAENDDARGKESNSGSADVQGEVVLKLGETGALESILGKYEITLQSIKSYDSIDGKTPANHAFTTVGITFKNVGETTLDADGIARGYLVSSRNKGGLDFVENFTGYIEPGESISGEMFFDHLLPVDGKYKLKFGNNFASTPDLLIFQYTSDDIN